MPRASPRSQARLGLCRATIVSAPGQLQPKTKITISAKTTARIVELPFEEGATVKKGDLLVQLDSKDLEAQLKGSVAQVMDAQTQPATRQGHSQK